MSADRRGRGPNSENARLISVRTLAIATASILSTLPVGLCTWWVAQQAMPQTPALAVTAIAMLTAYGRCLDYLHERVG